jgi:RNA polymerase sigma-70 factor (family 1)
MTEKNLFDESAFKKLYDLHFPMLFVTIREYVGDHEAAKDIVANAFAKLYQYRARMRNADHVKGFLYLVARNEAADFYRNQQRQRAVAEGWKLLTDKEYRHPLEAELEREEWMLKIRRLVEQLPPARKKIFELNFDQGLSIREIANLLNLTETTVRNQRNRALSFLRQAFFL